MSLIEIQKSNLQLKRKHSALRRFPDSIGAFAYGGELMRKRGEGIKGSTKGGRDFVGGDRHEPIDGEDGGICCMEDVPVAGEKRQKEQVEGRAGISVDRNQELGEHDLPAKGEKGRVFIPPPFNPLKTTLRYSKNFTFFLTEYCFVKFDVATHAVKVLKV